MEIKRYAKRLFALGTGALMLGATAMGAMAADLKDYPAFLVKDGSFNGYMVVGENAKPIDNLAMTDIAAGMKYKKAAEVATTTVSGDAWKVGTSAKFLEMTDNGATAGWENFYNISTFIGSTEMKALAGGTYSTGDKDYSYKQYLYWDSTDSTNEIVKYVEDPDTEVTADHFVIANGKNIGRYYLEFTSPAASDVTDSAGTASTTGTYLDDFENTKLGILGTTYDIVLARRPDSENTIKLTLMTGSVRDSLSEGEEKTFTISGKEYKVKLSYTDSDEAKFIVNGEATDKMKVGETKKLSDGKEIGVSEILYQEYAGGVHSATFFLGANKMELRDDNVESTSNTAYNVVMGTEDIDGTSIQIAGTDNNVTFKVNSITVSMTAEDDYYVPANSKLSSVIATNGDEKEVLFTGNWDIEYKGLSSEKTHDIAIKTSTDKRYTLEFTDGNGEKVEAPIAYLAGAYNITVGEEAAEKDLHAAGAEETINRNDYFVLTGGTPNTDNAKTFVLKYTGGDSTAKSSPKVKFKDMGSKETLEYTTASTVTLKLGGYEFAVEYLNTSADNSDINVTTDDDLKDYYGAKITIGALSGAGNSSNPDSFLVTVATPNGDDYDTLGPQNLVLNVSAGSSTTDLSGALSSTYSLLQPEGVTDVSYGYTTMGGKVTYNQPTSSPNTLTYAYPEAQVLPQVYVTSGAITESTTSEGTWTPVAIVDATKLDSEVADYKAQNLIVVGGPCVNTIAATLLGNPAECASGFTAGVGLVKLFENGDKVAMLVAGYSGEDTRAAGKFVANKWKDLSGKEVNIETASGSITTVAKVEAAPVVAETPAVAPAAE